MRFLLVSCLVAACGPAAPREPATPVARGGPIDADVDCNPAGLREPVEIYCYNVTTDPCCGTPRGAAWQCSNADYAVWLATHCRR